MWRSAVQVCLGLRSRQRTLVALPCYGGLAQLARAPALQAGGQRFESVILHFGILVGSLRSLTCWTSKTAAACIAFLVLTRRGE